uniref:hypothetical protein n=1 Tax=Trichocoleus desertorum TaxID=1481672 RepID=UPI0025B57B86|nr:hypothetical protein [Trichocoleus desertorum]
MLSDKLVVELRAVLQTQNRILQNCDQAVSEIETTLANVETSFRDVDSLAEQIRELDQIMAELEVSVDLFEEEDFSDFRAEEILQLYNKRRALIKTELTKIEFRDWDSFVRNCQVYSLRSGLDPLAPYEAFLTQADLKRLQDESYDAQFKWDKWDYMFVGASGILAALTDYFLVGIPQTIKTGEYAGQVGNSLTAWLKKYDTTRSDDWFAQWAQNLSDICKVPYDNQDLIGGMNPKSHRFQSLGHDPVLGFVFGVLDILRGTITGFSYDKITQTHSWVCQTVPAHQSIGLIKAVLKHIGHLISDVATPMGLPAPFMTLVQGINLGSFGENQRTVGEVARWMYLNGYDFRHFLVSGLTPAVVEIVLRAYIMLRHYSEHGEVKFDLASHPKYRSMLLAAHSIATLGNAGKIALMQGNPLAINQAEWMALIRYLIPSIKYWMFDEHRLRLEHMQRINDAGWDELLQNSDRLLGIVAQTESQIITLGSLA